jgi:hypothetical protein
MVYWGKQEEEGVKKKIATKISFLVTVMQLFGWLRAPRTFLSDRCTSFWLVAGSKNLS